VKFRIIEMPNLKFRAQYRDWFFWKDCYFKVGKKWDRVFYETQKDAEAAIANFQSAIGIGKVVKEIDTKYGTSD
jgi:hypothetical protein